MTFIPGYQSGSHDKNTIAARPARLSMRWSGPIVWGWAGVLAGGIAIFLGWCCLGYIGGFIGLVTGMFLAVSVTHAAKEMRAARATVILSYLENAVRLNLPLHGFLQAASRGESRAVGKALRNIAADIGAGGSVGTSLALHVREISPHTANAIGASESTGQLKNVLSRIVSRQYNDAPSKSESQGMSGVYPLVLILTGAWILLGIIIFVVPKFEEIFKDFKTELPWFTKHVLLSMSRGMDDYGVFVVLALLIAMVAFVLGRSIRYVWSPWWPGLFVGRLVDFFSWHVPFWRSLQRHRALSEVCRFVGDAVRGGIPLPDALLGACGLYMNHSIRRQIIGWRQALLRGQEPADAAAEAGLPKVIVGFLSAAAAPGKSSQPDALPRVLDFLAEYYANRFSRAAVTLRSLAEPLMTLVMGFIVGSVVIGLFEPLVVLINSVMDWKGRDLL